MDVIPWCDRSYEAFSAVLARDTIYFVLCVVLTLESATIQMKPLQQYFHMVLFIYYVVQTFESVDEILCCYHSNETSSAVLSHGTIYYLFST